MCHVFMPMTTSNFLYSESNMVIMAIYLQINLSIKSGRQYAYYGFVTETYGYVAAVLCLGSQM